jgi:hypothetical protein
MNRWNASHFLPRDGEDAGEAHFFKGWNKEEEQTGFKDIANKKSASPYFVVKLPVSAFEQMVELKAENIHEVDGEEREFSLLHPDYGSDVSIRYNPDAKTAAAYYRVSMKAATPLNKDEYEALAWDLSLLYPEFTKAEIDQIKASAENYRTRLYGEERSSSGGRGRSRDADDGFDDDAQSSRRSRGDIDDDAPPPRRGRNDDDDPPARSRNRDDDEPPRRSRNDDRDDPPARSRSRDDDEPPRRGRNDDDEPPSRSRRDIDDEPPSRSRRDEPPARGGRGSRDADDSRDDPPPRRGRNDDDEPPSRSRRNDDDEPPARGNRGRSADRDEPPARDADDSRDDPPSSPWPRCPAKRC